MKKKYFIVGIIIIVYIVIMILIFGSKSKDNKNQYMFIGNQTKWRLVNNEWLDISNLNQIINDNKFYVYDESGYIGNYELNYVNNKWYIFDDNQNPINLNGELFAVNKKIEVKNYEISAITESDIEKINKYNKKSYLTIKDLDNLTTNQKIVVDLDSDNNDEILYFISNMFTSNQQDNGKYFSYVLYLKNNRLYELKNTKKTQNNRFDSYNYSISKIIDYNSDGKYEIIINKIPFRPYGECKIMYGFKNNKYQIIKDCD